MRWPPIATGIKITHPCSHESSEAVGPEMNGFRSNKQPAKLGPKRYTPKLPFDEERIPNLNRIWYYGISSIRTMTWTSWTMASFCYILLRSLEASWLRPKVACGRRTLGALGLGTVLLAAVLLWPRQVLMPEPNVRRDENSPMLAMHMSTHFISFVYFIYIVIWYNMI